MALLSGDADASMFVPIVEQERRRKNARRQEECCEIEPLLRQASTISKAGRRALEACAAAEGTKGDFVSAGSAAFWRARLMNRRPRDAQPAYTKWSNAVTSPPRRPPPPLASQGGGYGSRLSTPGSRLSSASSYGAFASPPPRPPPLTRSNTSARFEDLARLAEPGEVSFLESLKRTAGVTLAPDPFSKHEGKIYQSSVRALRGPRTMFNQRTHNRFRGGARGYESMLLM